MNLAAHPGHSIARVQPKLKPVGSLAVSALATVASFLLSGGNGVSRSLAQQQRSMIEPVRMPSSPDFLVANASRFQQLTPEGVVQLHTMLNVARLAGLHSAALTYHANEAQEFYASFDHCLPWIHDRKPTDQARRIIQELQAAEAKGLRPEDYDGPLWSGRLAAVEPRNRPSELDLVRFDVALTLSTIRFLSDLHVGRVNPQEVHFALDIRDKTLDLSTFVREELVNARDPRAAIESIEPQFLAYRRTLQALHTYLELMRQENRKLLPNPSQAIVPGGAYRGVQRLEQLLRLLGDLTGAPAQRGHMTYDSDLVDAVKHFQRRHGLEDSGLLDADTLRELNTPIRRRVTQLQLTLERWRWLPATFSRPPIVVNIPEFRLHVIDEEHRVVSSMNVVVGRAYHHETPVFESEIKTLIFRPYWNVPLEIQRDELVPQVEKNPRYLVENFYEVVNAHGNIVDEPAITDETKDELRAGRLFLRQRPGAENSLGLIKFELPNPYDVYLHGTPAQELFSKSRRDFSHGCVRVQDPVELAVWVLRDNPGWTAERIRAAMNGTETLRVDLGRPTPIWILYGTAIVLEDGQVRFFQDIYGHDAALERALEQNDPDTSQSKGEAGIP